MNITAQCRMTCSQTMSSCTGHKTNNNKWVLDYIRFSAKRLINDVYVCATRDSCMIVVILFPPSPSFYCNKSFAHMHCITLAEKAIYRESGDDGDNSKGSTLIDLTIYNGQKGPRVTMWIVLSQRFVWSTSFFTVLSHTNKTFFTQQRKTSIESLQMLWISTTDSNLSLVPPSWLANPTLKLTLSSTCLISRP